MIKEMYFPQKIVDGEIAKDPNDYERLGLDFPPIPPLKWCEDSLPDEKPRLTVGMEQIIADAKKALPWVIEKTLIDDTLTVIYGPPKQYKTFVALDMALSQATGLPFLGEYRVLKTGLVIYAAGEGVAGIGQRVLAWCLERGVEDQHAVPFRRTKGAIQIGDGDASVLAAEIEEIAKETDLPVAGIYIDTLARNFGSGDENSNKDMNVFIAQCDIHLKMRFRVPVVIVHHSGHEKSDRARGASSLMGAADGQTKVTCDHPKVFYEPDFHKDAETPPCHVLSVEKIYLGYEDQFGDPVKSIVLRMTDETPKPKLKIPQDAKLALDLLDEGPEDYEKWRGDFMFEAEKVPVQKGVNKGQKRDNNAIRKAWGRAVSFLEINGLITVERDNNQRVLNACRVRGAEV